MQSSLNLKKKYFLYSKAPSVFTKSFPSSSRLLESTEQSTQSLFTFSPPTYCSTHCNLTSASRRWWDCFQWDCWPWTVSSPVTESLKAVFSRSHLTGLLHVPDIADLSRVGLPLSSQGTVSIPVLLTSPCNTDDFPKLVFSPQTLSSFWLSHVTFWETPWPTDTHTQCMETLIFVHPISFLLLSSLVHLM